MEQNKRQVLGILGGLGPAASCYLYQMLIDHTPARKDQDHIDLVLSSRASTPDRTAFITGQSDEDPFDIMEQDGRSLVRYGATVLAIPCNTSHYFADRLQGQLKIPLIHMIRETVAFIAAQGKRKVGILATDGTVRTGIYQTALTAAGLIPVTLPEDLQKTVMSIIYDEIKRGETGSREKFGEIDAWLRQAGCDCAILGCTELSVYRVLHSLPPFYIDAMEVLAEQAILRCGKQLRNV